MGLSRKRISLAPTRIQPPVSKKEGNAYVEAMAKPDALTVALNWYRAQFMGMDLAVATRPAFPKLVAPTMMIWKVVLHRCVV